MTFTQKYTLIQTTFYIKDTASSISNYSTNRTASSHFFSFPGKLLFILSLSFFLSACGGGSGSSDVDQSAEQQIITKLAPLAVVGDDITADATSTVTLDGSESNDPDGTIVSYEWQQTSGSYSVDLVDFDESIANFTAPDVDADTQLTFDLIVTDNDGAKSSASVNVSIKRVNKAPSVAVAASSINASGNSQVILDGSATSDSDGTIVNYEWVQTSGSSTVTIADASTATASFTAPNLTTQLSFQLTATDNDGVTDSKIVTVNINAIAIYQNKAPVASVASLINTIGNKTTTLNGTGSFDPDGSLVSYSWEQISGSPRVSLNETSNPAIHFTAPNISTQLVFQLTVTDNDGAKSVASTTVKVRKIGGQTETNQAPTANVVHAFNAEEYTLQTLNGSSSYDPDGTITSYSWTQIAGAPSVVINSPNSAIANFTAPGTASPTALTFELSVTDNAGAVDTGTVTVTIYPANQDPQTTGVATLTWTAPTENTDNSPLTDLAGFRVYYGNAENQLTHSITVASFNNFAEIEGLTNDLTYYFAVTAFNQLGVESERSNITSKLIE